ncbi:hypothetical protein BH11MYX1_BH11MYX1_19550 [soil metagenome]
MAAYHVFVDGSVDASAEGRERLAAAIATHYGLPIVELRTRIASGRFRVKGNAERATADTYVRDLELLGARCSIETASDSNVSKTPLPFPVITTPAVARTTSGSKNFQSGLSAAFSGEQQLGGLGALDADGTVFTLSSVDGHDGADAPPAAAFAPPASPQPAVVKAPPAAARAVVAPQGPIDMFAPPDADDDNVQVNLEPEEEQRAANKRVSIPPATAPAGPPARPSRPSLQAPPARDVVTGPRPSGLADPQLRFAAGVIIAILVGFIPAHFVASMRERTAYAEIDAKVDEVQKQSETPDTYASLDAFRLTQLEHKREDRRNAALLAMLVWAAAGAGVAFVWFKKLAPPTS